MPSVRVVLTQVDFLVPASEIVGDLVGYTLEINGEAMRLPAEDLTVPDNRRLTLSVEHTVDVSGRRSFRVRFQVVLRHGLTRHRPMGWIEREVQWPFYEGEYRDANSNWAVTWYVDRAGEGLGEAEPTADRATFARDSSEGTILNTVGGTPAPIRVEVHPVLPVPATLPRRPTFTPGSGRPRFWSAGIYDGDLPGDPRIVQNPPVVPIVAASQHDIAGDATTIRVTFMQPRTIRGADLEWSQRSLEGSGRVEFVGGQRGLSVRVRGVTQGEVGLEVRYRGAMAASYRLLVRRLKIIPCRGTICHAGTAATTPVSDPAAILSHINIANRFLMQLGILLQLDRDPTCRDGAVATGVPGIFRLQVPQGQTVNAPELNATAPTLNYRPWVFNFAYIVSDPRNNLGMTTDFQNSPVTTVSDSGTPSSSLIPPCGIPPDDAATTQTMTLLASPQQRATNLFAMYVTDNNPTLMDFGGTIAHEFGHAIGLCHRVNRGGTTSDDGILHPPRENLMNAVTPTFEAQDFDLLQARAVLHSPLIAHY